MCVGLFKFLPRHIKVGFSFEFFGALYMDISGPSMYYVSKGQDGWGKKITIFADIQYYTYAEINSEWMLQKKYKMC